MSTAVILYSLGFMDVPSERRSYYAEISLFAAGMMLFAIGADLITLFIGWELIRPHQLPADRVLEVQGERGKGRARRRL